MHTPRSRPRRASIPVNLAPLDPTRAPDWPLWQCTAEHELACNCVDWSSEAGRFSGPFNIARTTWAAYAGWPARRYPDAAAAPPWVQLVGARNVRARVGSSEWGGLARCGG